MFWRFVVICVCLIAVDLVWFLLIAFVVVLLEVLRWLVGYPGRVWGVLIAWSVVVPFVLGFVVVCCLFICCSLSFFLFACFASGCWWFCVCWYLLCCVAIL